MENIIKDLKKLLKVNNLGEMTSESSEYNKAILDAIDVIEKHKGRFYLDDEIYNLKEECYEDGYEDGLDGI